MDVAQPELGESGLTFRLVDRAHRLSAVRLVPEVELPGDLQFEWRRGRWSLTVRPPDTDRLEYLLGITQDGHERTTPDPGNPRRVDGAFGQKSVFEAPGYRAPSWLDLPPVPAVCSEFEIDEISGALWAPETLPDDEPAPLLVVHDGPEYADLAGLLDYLAASIGDGTLPPLRAGLLAPGDRNARYSADDGYARALCCSVVPELRRTATLVVGVGASLGALAMLHAHCRYPQVFDGLLLQSGSFFTAQLDPQERGFPGFEPVTQFVEGVEGCAARPVPTAMTCGTVEENFANNRRMHEVLSELGYPVDFATVRDAHNYTAWRDALDPNLTRLLHGLIRERAA